MTRTTTTTTTTPPVFDGGVPIVGALSWPTPMNRRFTKARRTLDDIVMGIIAARRTGLSAASRHPHDGAAGGLKRTRSTALSQ